MVEEVLPVGKRLAHLGVVTWRDEGRSGQAASGPPDPVLRGPELPRDLLFATYTCEQSFVDPANESKRQRQLVTQAAAELERTHVVLDLANVDVVGLLRFSQRRVSSRWHESSLPKERWEDGADGPSEHDSGAQQTVALGTA